MKVNLRKAASLQSQLRAAITDRLPQITGEFEMPLWKVNDEQLAVERTHQMSLLSDVDRLESILVAIREKTANENIQNGVSNLLSEKASVQAQVTRLTRLSKVSPVMSSDDLTRRAEDMTEQNKNNPYHRTDRLNVGIFSLKDIEKFKTTLVRLRRRQVEIDDKLIAANISSEIAIPDQDWAWLEDQGIV